MGAQREAELIDMHQLFPPDHDALVRDVIAEYPFASIDMQIGFCMARSHGKANPATLREKLSAARPKPEDLAD